MSLFNSDVVPLIAGGYTIDQSLRFNDDDTAYLSRIPSSGGDTQKMTISCWVKRGNMGTATEQKYVMFGTSSSNNPTEWWTFEEDRIGLGSFGVGGTNYVVNAATTAKFRDPAAWYHIVFSIDTTQSTTSNRLKIYVNGENQALSAGMNGGSYTTMTQNANLCFNSNSYNAWIGDAAGSYPHFDGYMAEINFIDGQQLDASYFGETGTYGEWKPIEYTGTYGTNGFYLPFKQDYQVEGFSATLYTGTGTTQYIGGVGFQPDLVWMKKRSTGTARSHRIVDSVRTSAKYLASDNTNSEDNTSGAFVSFENDGFTVGTTSDAFNGSGSPYVAWNWDMGDFENSELLTNGDFSTGSTSGWTTELGTYNVVTYGGNYVLDPATDGDSFLTQEVSVTAGTDYIVRANIPSYSSGNVWLYVYDSDYTDYNSRGTLLGGGSQTNSNSYHIAVTPSG